MSQPFSFDPKDMSQQLENWQKFWFGAFANSPEPQTEESGEPKTESDDFLSYWRGYMAEQSRFWQNAWGALTNQGEAQQAGASGAEGKEGESLRLADNPFFKNLREMYKKSCEFVETQLQANAAGLPEDKRESLMYMTNQYLRAINPDNFLLTNPDALEEAVNTKGKSVVQGMQNYFSDMEKGRISMSDDTKFEIGENICCTPGKVVLRTELIELIQYAPTTEQVYERPLLIIPPFVNKYYLMDLAPENSFVSYFVSQGYTVYLVSWRSATNDMKFFSWDTYAERGVILPINVVRSISGQDKINILGFCVGGLMLSTVLAVLKARGEDVIESAIFMTSLADHSIPGDIKYFITEEFVRAREAQSKKGGIVSGLELQATFSALRPDDLIWNYVQDNYLKGKTPKPFDLLYWNNDSVDLPMPMHTFFLREFYMKNGLTNPGSVTVCGIPIDLGTIDIPLFFFSAERDHIVPWKGVYKGMPLFRNAPERHFVLGQSGHIAGAINPVSKDRRSYWLNPDLSLDPDTWKEKAQNCPGSWWKEMNKWLSGRSGKKIPAPTEFGSNLYRPICEAPGDYVKAKAIPAMLTHFM